MCTDKILEKTVSFKHNTNLRFKKIKRKMTASNMTAEINSATSNVSSFKDDLSVSELPSLFRKKGNPKRGKKHLGQTRKSTKWLTLFVRMKITESYWFLSIHKTSLNVIRWERKKEVKARLRRQKNVFLFNQAEEKKFNKCVSIYKTAALTMKKASGISRF